MVNSFGFWTNTNLMTVMSLQANGNVLIGTRDDSGAKLQVNGGVEAYSISRYDSGTGYFVGARNSGLGVTDGGLLLYTYGNTPMSFYTNAASRMQITGDGNVLIGSTTDNGAKLQVEGNIIAKNSLSLYESDNIYFHLSQTPWYATIQSTHIGTAYLPIAINGQGGNVGIGTYNPQATLDVAGSARVNEITIGGIKLDVVNGALRVNGDIFSTGQFAASVAGEATGGNIVLDYASIVNALGYTPANNNNLAQVAFTGSYNSLLNTPSVYTKEEVYNKNEINQKLAGVGGSGGSIGSTFGLD